MITGGLDAYAGSYDALAERFGFTLGERGTLVLTPAGLLVWGVFASTVQVGVYRRGLGGWPDAAAAAAEAPPARERTAGRFDPRAVTLAAAVAFALLLSGTDWPLLGAVRGVAGARLGHLAPGQLRGADRARCWRPCWAAARCSSP